MDRVKLLVFATLAMYSSVVQSYTLIDVYEKAIKNNLSISAAETRIDAVRERVKASKSRLLPQVNISLGGKVSKEWRDVNSENTFAIDDSVESTALEQFGEVTIGQTIFDREVLSNIKTSKVELSISTLELEKQIGLTTVDVVAAYFNVIRNMSALEVEQETALALSHGLASIQRRMNEGMAVYSDISEAKSALATQKAQVTLAKNTLKSDFDTIIEITGEQISHIYTLKEDYTFAKPPEEQEQYWIGQAKENSVAIKLADLGVEHANRQYTTTKSRHYPKIHSYISYRNSTVESAYSFSPNDNAHNAGYNFHVTLTVPLFNPQIRFAKQEALHNKTYFEDLKQLRIRDVERQTKSLLYALKSNASIVQARKDSVRYSEEALRSDMSRYNAGLIEYRNIIESIQNLASTKLSLIDAEYEYVYSYITFREAIGLISNQDVASLNTYLDTSKKVYSP